MSVLRVAERVAEHVERALEPVGPLPRIRRTGDGRLEPDEAYRLRGMVEHDRAVDEEERGIGGVGGIRRRVVQPCSELVPEPAEPPERSVRARRARAGRVRADDRDFGEALGEHFEDGCLDDSLTGGGPARGARVTVPRSASAVMNGLAACAAASTLTPATAPAPLSSHTA